MAENEHEQQWPIPGLSEWEIHINSPEMPLLTTTCQLSFHRNVAALQRSWEEIITYRAEAQWWWGDWGCHSLACRCPSSNRIYLWKITTPCLSGSIICKLPSIKTTTLIPCWVAWAGAICEDDDETNQDDNIQSGRYDPENNSAVVE